MKPKRKAPDIWCQNCGKPIKGGPRSRYRVPLDCGPIVTVDHTGHLCPRCLGLILAEFFREQRKMNPT